MACPLPYADCATAPGRLLLVQGLSTQTMACFVCCSCSNAQMQQCVREQQPDTLTRMNHRCGAVQAVHVRGVAYMLQLPRALPGTANAANLARASPGGSPAAEQTEAAAALPAPTGWSTEGLPRVLRHGTMHLPPYVRLAAHSYTAFGPDQLRQVGSVMHQSCWKLQSECVLAACQ